MLSVYMRLGAYAVAVAACIALGWHMGSLGPKAALASLQAQDAQASAKAFQDAAMKIQQVQDDYNAKLKVINDANTAQVQASAARDSTLLASLHDYQNALSSRPVSQGSASTGTVPNSPAIPSGVSSIASLTDRLAAATRSVDDAVAAAVHACSADATELAGAQAERAALTLTPHT